MLFTALIHQVKMSCIWIDKYQNLNLQYLGCWVPGIADFRLSISTKTQIFRVFLSEIVNSVLGLDFREARDIFLFTQKVEAGC